MTAPVPSITEAADRLQADELDLTFVHCYEAAVASQSEDCDVTVYGWRLAEALHRRVANLWASKAHTLGVMDTGPDFGVSYVPQYDPVVDGLERPFRLTTTVVA